MYTGCSCTHVKSEDVIMGHRGLNEDVRKEKPYSTTEGERENWKKYGKEHPADMVEAAKEK